jgi:ketosteroid isomerase-like protein
MPTVRSNREIARDAFAAWATGTGHVTSIFAPDMTFQIEGRSAVAHRYENTQQFLDEVLHPFGARFRPTAPFRPTRIRGVYADDRQNVVTVVWEGEGTTVDGTSYQNTYAWLLTFADGLVVDGTAFFDSIAFNELWETVKPAQ